MTYIISGNDSHHSEPAFIWLCLHNKKNNVNTIQAIAPTTFLRKAREKDMLILDVRQNEHFIKGFISGAINIGMENEFEMWVQLLLNPHIHLLLVTEPGKEPEAAEKLIKIGYNHIEGFLAGGMQQWMYQGLPYEIIDVAESDDLKFLIEMNDTILIDLRRRSEIANGIIKNARNIPLDELSARLPTLDRNKEYILYCINGYRSVIGASILRASGFKHLFNINGGIDAIRLSHPELLKR